MRATGATHDAHTITIRSAVVGVVALVATFAMTGVVEAAMDAPDPDPDYPPSSDQGVDPDLLPGGRDRKCTDLDPSFTGSAHVEAGEEMDIEYTLVHSEEEDDHEHEFPEGLTYDIDGSTVSWSSDFPLAAVIVKGGPNSYAYVYEPNETSDGNLVTPINSGGNPADVSSVRFCWEGEPEQPSIAEVCLDAIDDAGLMGTTWVEGPVEIREGLVDVSTVPAGFTITFIDGQVGFESPDDVAFVVTEASEAVVHAIDPPAKTGSVPLASNPGDGDVVLCGVMEEPPVVAPSCEDVPDTLELGPIMITAGVVDASSIPAGVTSVTPNTDSVDFVSAVPVAAAIIAASEPELYAFTPEVFEGSVPAVLDGEAELVLCVREVNDDPGDDPSDDPSDDPVDTTSDDPVDTTSDDPVVAGSDPSTIPTGGGPSGRTAFLLVAFVVLALSASAGLLAWSRGG